MSNPAEKRLIRDLQKLSN